MTWAEGPLARMLVAQDDPVIYTARLGDTELPLAGALGRGLEIRYLGRITCGHCGADTARSYGGGYCYRCFKTLARCDLCVVSPDRCHYAQGTCREPAWGESFCMQPHLLYLANSSGAKVGITGAGKEIGRWLDQGACQGLVIMSAATRQQAGIAEARLATRVADRTDWRAMVSRDVAALDLVGLGEQLQSEGLEFPDGVAWQRHQPQKLRYPILRYGHRVAALRLDEQAVIRGNLLGIKGQYLLFDHGVFNVRHHTSYHVRLTLLPDALPPGAGDDHQMELFS